MTPRTLLHPAAAPQGAIPDHAHPFRDRIAARCEPFAAAFPKAVNLEAQALADGHRIISGSAAHLRGLHSAQGWIERLLGGRHTHGADLFRLAAEPTREARGYVKAYAAPLVGAIGYRLELQDVRAIDGLEVAASVAESGGAAAAGLCRALDDGRIDPEEAAHLEPAVERLEINAARARALLTQAKARAGERA